MLTLSLSDPLEALATAVHDYVHGYAARYPTEAREDRERALAGALEGALPRLDGPEDVQPWVDFLTIPSHCWVAAEAYREWATVSTPPPGFTGDPAPSMLALFGREALLRQLEQLGVRESARAEPLLSTAGRSA